MGKDTPDKDNHNKKEDDGKHWQEDNTRDGRPDPPRPIPPPPDPNKHER